MLLYIIQIKLIYNPAILVTVTSGGSVKRVTCIYKIWTWTFVNSADTDQMVQNEASDEGLHCLLKVQ